MALTKTANISVLSLQQIAANAVVNSSAWDVSSYCAANLFINLGRDDTGGALTAGVIFRVQASAKDSGDDQWRDVMTFQSGVTNPESEAVSGTCNSGQKVIGAASTTNLSVEDLIFIKNTTLANSEFHRIKAVTANTNVTVDDDLTNAQTGSTVYDQAEEYVAPLDLTAIKRIRLQVDNAQNARTVCVEAIAVAAAF
jgi:hypothetical protein